MEYMESELDGTSVVIVERQVLMHSMHKVTTQYSYSQEIWYVVVQQKKKCVTKHKEPKLLSYMQ